MTFRICRETRETKLSLELSLTPGPIRVSLGCGFLEHMMELMAHHAGWTLTLEGKGDIQVDDHHLTEDVGIVLGQALLEAGRAEKRARYGWCALPMDGTLILAAADFSGRGLFVPAVTFPTEKCGSFDLELVPEFFRALCREARLTLHLREMTTDNSHHLAEALFKGTGRALRQALAPSEEAPSTKGAWL